MSDALPGAGTRLATHGVLPEGRLVGGRYRILSVVGEGAHSVVYLAKREGGPSDAGGEGERRPGLRVRLVPPGTEVALKVIHRHLCGDPQIFKRFQREAAILGRLEGEHVAKLLDFVEDDGLLAIALERVEGTSLEALLAEKAPLPIDAAIEIALQVCAALGAAHANGIVHRDLKPANVLVERTRPVGGAETPPTPPDRSGKPTSGQTTLTAAGVRVKVVDFGLAKVLQGEMTTGLTEQGMIFGTAEYMSPEQARGDEEVDARADLYAVGVMLYEMVVGRPPFRRQTAIDTMTAHLLEVPPSPRAGRGAAEISPALEAVMLRALAKSPADRYDAARDLAEAIAAARDQPRVFAPIAVANPEEMGSSDTDLNLDQASSIAQAKTLRAEELAAMQKISVPPARVSTSNRAPPSSIPATLPSAVDRPKTPKPAPSSPRAAALRIRTEILDEDTAVSGELPRRSGWVWAVVAILAAAIGVVLGVIVGTR